MGEFLIPHVVEESLNSLNLPHAKRLIIALLERGETPISNLRDVVKTYTTLRKIVEGFESEGLVKTEERFEGRRVIYVRLTERGQFVAQKIREAEMIMEGEFPGVLKMERDWREKRFGKFKLLNHVNAYDNVVRVEDSSYSPPRIAEIEIGIRGRKLMLHCSICDASDCEHINYLWSLKEVRETLLKKAEDEGVRV